MTFFTITTSALSHDGSRERLTFCCPDAGGYVRLDNGAGRQVCRRLDTLGATLMADEHCLEATIRRELRARQKLNRRQRQGD